VSSSRTAGYTVGGRWREGEGREGEGREGEGREGEKEDKLKTINNVV